MSAPPADRPACFVSPDRVVVWTARPHSAVVQARLDRYEAMLTGDERARAARFLQPNDRVRFIVGRALARTMLSAAVAPAQSIAPADWPIVIDAHGRPELGRCPEETPDLRFNLTHTDGLVACALTVGREVGVDVENVHRRLLHPTLPERYFAPREVADLRRLPETEQGLAFFDYWTLKEAYIKARGLGLALPLGQFAFVPGADGAPAIEFAPELDDDAASWQFARFRPTPDHRMAVAVRRRGADLAIIVADVAPEVSA